MTESLTDTPAAPVRVLHLFSNCKWTGPAEPALNLCLALRRRGVEADFACAPDAGSSVNKVVETARERGLEPILDLHLSKHRHPIKNWRDSRTLGRLLDTGRYHAIHCHLDNDHGIAVGPARKRGIPVVRSSYHGEGMPPSARHARLLAATARLIEPSQAALEHDTRTLHYPREHACVIPGAVDTQRFDPGRDTPGGRCKLGIPPEAFVLGIVARMQTHRHYEDLFQAFHALLQDCPEARLVVVGRGTNQETVGFQPVAELGLQDHVHFTGFVDGEDYAGMLRAFDAGVFLTPGSDGTCRAAREILAMGKPMVVADRGMLREIVQDGETGFVCDGAVDSLYQAFRRLAKEKELRQRMGRAARDYAQAVYSLEAQSAAMLEVYRGLLRA